MSENRKNHFIAIADDRLWKSVARDIASTMALISSVVVGVFIGSQALQWIGGLLWVVWTLSRLSNVSTGHLTIEEARKKLDELEASDV